MAPLAVKYSTDYDFMNSTDTYVVSFAQDIAEGLSAPRKYISSKYFYDAAGDALFQKIMHLPEYYLTAAEFEIFREQSAPIIAQAGLQNGVQVIELGAGDGTKTKLLLKEMMKSGLDFTYCPIDISAHALQDLEKNLKTELREGLNLQSVTGEYFEALQSDRFSHERQKCILFLGSTIGNFDHDDGTQFISKLSEAMHPSDVLMVGFDLKKEPQVILDAYNDKAGITRAFNLNLLLRINRELGADFDIGKFSHYPLYDPELGAAKSYLVSRKAQTVYIAALDRRFTFEAGEVIFTEISRKYHHTHIQRLADAAGLRIEQSFHDSKRYFTDVLMRK